MAESGGLQAVCGNAARTLVGDKFVLDLLAIGQAGEASALNSGDVNENV